MTAPTVAALQTTRGANVGVPGKNVLRVDGRPLFMHNLEAALETRNVPFVYAISDIELVHELAPRHGYRALPLSPEAAAGNHYEAIRCGCEAIESELGTLDVLVVLLGNSAGATAAALERAVGMLLDDPTLDSVCSVSEFNTFNPLRALRLNGDGLLEALVPETALVGEPARRDVNARDVLGDVLFFNGSFWACRREALLANDGPPPFPWLGTRIAAARQDPCMEVDAPWQVAVVEAYAHAKAGR